MLSCRKALSLLRHVWNRGPYSKLAVDKRVISTLAGFVGHQDIDLRENALRALVHLVGAHSDFGTKVKHDAPQVLEVSVLACHIDGSV